MLTQSTPFGEASDNPAARAVLERYLPGIVASPQAAQLSAYPLGMIIKTVPSLRDDDDRTARLWAELETIEHRAATDRPHAPRIEPDPRHEGEHVAPGSAHCLVPGPTPQWAVVEIELHGPTHGNPFVDVDLWATFECEGRELRVGGFYDGDGVYRIRMLAEQVGTWEFRTGSTARSLDGITGEVLVVGAEEDAHGPVRVDGFHFRYADGTRYRPWGTTAYAWTHQVDELQERTLETLASAPFTKVRMCLLPKSFLFNTNDPQRFPFVSLDEGFDHTRFDVEFFRELELRIIQLAALGVEADLILFHPYDRWGFADMGPAADERLVTYTVRRLAAYHNVWWSMANEYDLLVSKSIEDWERLALVVQNEDPHQHLLSIHNCLEFYDNGRPWVTHSSLQRVDVYRTAENSDTWRDRWGKPVVIDECGYEGDLEHGWGNLMAEELVRRLWEGAVRGGYVGHGETYLNTAEEIFWSKGGSLVGASPARIAFLEQIVAASPSGVLDPCPSDWDLPWGGVPGRYLIGYLGSARPRYRNVYLPPGRFRVDVLDTWQMSSTTLPGEHVGHALVPLPGRPFMAIRLERLDV